MQQHGICIRNGKFISDHRQYLKGSYIVLLNVNINITAHFQLQLLLVEYVYQC